MDHEILKRLYKYCAYQDRCISEVKKKLRDWEVPSEAWESFIAHLEDERFLDEKRYTHSFVRGKFFIKKWGKQKIRQALKQKQIPSHLIDQVMKTEIKPENYSQMLFKLIDQKREQYSNLEEQAKKEKIFRFLMQKGYEYASVRQAWAEYS